MSGALDGIRILEWAMWHHGSAAGYMLGDLGAEVIHIEDRKRGDAARGTSALYGMPFHLPGNRGLAFENANRNKKSITLDITKEKGKQLLYELVKKSDVFLTNFRKSVAERNGLGYETLKGYNPKIIYAAATGYGSKGPLAEKRSFDPLGQAYSGFMWHVGDRDHKEPLQPIGGICDQLGATMMAYGILAALVARDRLGIGQEVEASLLGTMIHLQEINMNATLLRGQSMARHSRARSRNPLSNMYECADGEWLVLAEPQSDRFWHDFCKALGVPQWEKDLKYQNESARRDNCQEINGKLAEIFLTKPRQEWLAILGRECGELAFGPILDLPQLANDPQVLENQYVVEIPDYPALGNIKVTGFPVRLSETPARVYRPAPEWGEHTEQVLMDICGQSWEDIAKLREEEVI